MDLLTGGAEAGLHLLAGVAGAGLHLLRPISRARLHLLLVHGGFRGEGGPGETHCERAGRKRDTNL
jgi:hypothetical protein